MSPTITPEQADQIRATLARMPNLPKGLGDKDNACSIAANNLNLQGVKALISFFQSIDHQSMTQEDQQTYLKLLPKILAPTTLFTINLRQSEV